MKPSEYKKLSKLTILFYKLDRVPGVVWFIGGLQLGIGFTLAIKA